MIDPWINVKCRKCGWRKQMPLRAADKVKDFPAVGEAAGGLRLIGVTCQKCGNEISQTLPMNPALVWNSPPATLGPRGIFRPQRNGTKGPV